MPRALGQVTTASTSKVPVASTTYTEQAAPGSQCSLQSSSANDAAGGTGARTVKITYYTLTAAGVLAGPFVETVTLNGTTSVPSVGTALCLIEKMEVVTAGSGGVAAGTISLYNAIGGSGGAGSVFCSIATGAVATRLGHHYVPSNRQCEVTDVALTGTDAAAALVDVVQTPYPLATEQSVTGPVGVTSAAPVELPFRPNASVVSGPARLRLLVTPANTDSQTTTASFGYVDRVSGAF